MPTGLPSGFDSGDPTPRTMQQVLRENFWLRELLESKLSNIDQKIESSDKAVRLLQAFADRTPTTMDVQHKVDALREVVIEKFVGVSNTFQQNGTALTAALQAQEKQAIATNDTNKAATDKMEAGFTKQFDALSASNKTDVAGVKDSINDIKDRLTIIESKTSIHDPTTAVHIAKLDASVARLNSTTDLSSGKSAGMVALWALLLGGIGSVLGIGMFVVALLKFMK